MWFIRKIPIRRVEKEKQINKRVDNLNLIHLLVINFLWEIEWVQYSSM